MSRKVIKYTSGCVYEGASREDWLRWRTHHVCGWNHFSNWIPRYWKTGKGKGPENEHSLLLYLACHEMMKILYYMLLATKYSLKAMDQMTTDFILWSCLCQTFWHCGEKIQPTQSPSSSHEVYSSITIFFSLKNLMSIEVVHMYTWMRFFILTKRNTQFQVEHMIHREIKLI